MINDALTEKQIEDIVRQHFYPGPVAGSTERLTKALNAVIRQALKSLEDAPTTTDRGVGGQVMDALWPLLGGNHMDAETWQAISNATMPIIKSPEDERDRLKADLAEACEVIAELRDQFAFYAEEHRKAGKTEKAETNERFRDRASQYLERVKQ